MIVIISNIIVTDIFIIIIIDIIINIIINITIIMIDLNITNDYGETPLDLARNYRNGEIVNILQSRLQI